MTHSVNSVKSLRIVHEQSKMLTSLYHSKCVAPSDINEHLPTLREYAMKCNSVVECGVREVVSSYAFAVGLSGNIKNRYYLVDPYKSQSVNAFLQLCEREGINATFFEQSDLECPLVNTDLLFIDTWHVYGQLKRELARWHSSVSKYIILHDTTVDEWRGETLRMNYNGESQSKESGIPLDEIYRGLWPAVEEFIVAHPEWKIERRFTNNNGLTILARVSC